MASTAADILRWTGAFSTLWVDAANWIIHAGAPLTTVPSAGEGVVFGPSTKPLLTGPSGALALNNGTVLSTYGLDFGAAGAAIANLAFNSGSDALFRYAGSCPRFFLDCTMDLLIVDQALQRIVLSNGVINDARISHAKVGIANNCDTPIVRAKNSVLNVAEHTTNTNRLDTLRLYKSEINTARDIDDGIALHSNIQVLETASIDDGGSGGLLVHEGGFLDWYSSGTPRIEGIEGQMKFSRAPADITIGHIVQWDDYYIDEVPPGLNVTFPADRIRVGATSRPSSRGLGQGGLPG